MRKPFLLLVVSIATLSSACGGGGAAGGASGGGGGPGIVRPFAAFSEVRAGDTVEAGAVSQSAVITVESSGALSSFETNPVDDSSRLRLSYGAAVDPVTIDGRTAHSAIAWTGPEEIACDNIACDTANAAGRGMIVNGEGMGWNYQSFGYWVADQGAIRSVVDAVSFGRLTEPGGIPASGTATYSGVTSGLYVDAGGWPSDYAASLTAEADFGPARSISFSTRRSLILPLGAEDLIAAPELDFAGALAIAPGANRFSGTVNTLQPAVRLSGSVEGRFYGPAAEEIGGVFTLTGSGTEALIGGFGAMRSTP